MAPATAFSTHSIKHLKRKEFVRKPRGAKPGLVEVSNEKTIRPDGDPARLARLLATAGERANDELEDVV